MTTRGISEDALLAQEECFARAFADGDPAVARDQPPGSPMGQVNRVLSISSVL